MVGEIAAGLMLGPSVLGLLPGNLPELLFPPDVRPFLSVLAQVGLLLFMFLIGWEFDPASLRGRRRSTGAIWLSAAGLPLVLGTVLAVVLHGSHGTVGGEAVPFPGFALFLGVAVSVAGLPVLARIVTDLRLQLSRVGTLALALAALDDVFVWCMLAVIAALVAASGAAGFVGTLGWGVVYLCAMVLVVRPLVARLDRRMPVAAAPLLPIAAAAGALLSAYATAQIGLHTVFGAFVFGLVMPRGGSREKLHRNTQASLENVSRLLLPVFFVVTGLSVDITRLTGPALAQMLLIIAVGCTAKFCGTVLPARLCGTAWRESAMLGVLMNTRGLTQLVILSVGLELGLLTTELFTALTVMALVTTAMTAPLMSLLLRRAVPESLLPEAGRSGPEEPAAPSPGPVPGPAAEQAPVQEPAPAAASVHPTP